MPVTLSNLPEEILCKIFGQLAPEAFELSETRNFSPRRDGGDDEDKDTPHTNPADEQLGDFLESRSALVALSRTSHLVRRISLPFLYENVVFTTNDRILAFLVVLMTYPERGKWVKQLTWLLPAPPPPPPPEEEGQDQNGGMLFPGIDHFLTSGQMFGGTDVIGGVGGRPTPVEYRPGINWLKAHLRSHVHRFPAGHLGAIAFPLLSLMSNLVTLNVSGYRAWLTRNREVVEQDPFFGFLDGRAVPDTEGFAGLVGALFPDHVLYDLRLGNWMEYRGGVTFPPPRLRIIVKSCPSLQLLDPPTFNTERVTLFEFRKAMTLVRLSVELRDVLDIPVGADYRLANADFISPSSIIRADANKYLDIARYLDVASMLVRDNGWRGFIDNLKGLPGKKDLAIGLPSQLKALDAESANFRAWFLVVHESVVVKFPFVMGQSVKCALLDLLHQGHIEDPRPGVLELTLVHPDHRFISRPMTGFSNNANLGVCISRLVPNLETLHMDLRLYIGNRRTIYHRFNPGVFKSVWRLTITVEALWGPVTTVLHMLSGDMGLDESDDSPTARETRNRVWEMRHKAIKRLPESIQSLHLIDWFSEYHLYQPYNHFSADSEEFDLGGVPRPSEWDSDTNPHDPMSMTIFYDYPEVRSPYPGMVVGQFSQTFGIRPPSPAPNPYRQAEDAGRSAQFTARYRYALGHGMVQLCSTTPPPFFSSLGEDEEDEENDETEENGENEINEPTRRLMLFSEPLVKSLRPRLKTIEFVYCLQSAIPSRRNDEEARRSDTLWREFCDSSLLKRCSDLIWTVAGINFCISGGSGEEEGRLRVLVPVVAGVGEVDDDDDDDHSWENEVYADGPQDEWSQDDDEDEDPYNAQVYFDNGSEGSGSDN